MRSPALFAALLLAASGASAAGFALRSPAFRDGDALPLAYTCGGNAASPPLAWTDPPAGARSFALIFAEPVVGALRVHWVVYDIPVSARGLPSRHVWRAREKDGTVQGRNGADRFGYAPPCPRTAQARTERFTLYALDARVPARLGYDAGELAARMKGHVLARAELTATDRR